MKEFGFIIIAAALLIVSGCVSNTPESVVLTEKGNCDITEKVSAGDMVKVEYVGTLEDGSEFDSGTFEFQSLSAQAIAGFDLAVNGSCVGDEMNVEVPPEDGYGQYDPAEAQIIPDMFIVPITFDVDKEIFVAQFGEEPEVGKSYFQAELIYPFIVDEANGNVTLTRNVTVGETYMEGRLWEITVTEVNDTHIISKRNAEDGQTVMTYLGAKPVIVNEEGIKIDLNHPLAGKTLFFYIKVLEIK